MKEQVSSLKDPSQPHLCYCLQSRSILPITREKKVNCIQQAFSFILLPIYNVSCILHRLDFLATHLSENELLELFSTMVPKLLKHFICLKFKFKIKFQ